MQESEDINQKFVKQFDEDGDNKLSANERSKAMERAIISVSPAIPSEEKSPAYPEILFERIDANGDGDISMEEAGEQRWKVFQQADRDQNEILTLKEWKMRNK